MKNIIYKSNFFSCFGLSFIISFIIFSYFITLSISFYILLFLFVFLVLFIFFYRFICVKLTDKKICISCFNFDIISIDYVDFNCKRYGNFMRNSRFKYGFFSIKNLYFYNNINVLKFITLGFLSWEDYFDIVSKIDFVKNGKYDLYDFDINSGINFDKKYLFDNFTNTNDFKNQYKKGCFLFFISCLFFVGSLLLSIKYFYLILIYIYVLLFYKRLFYGYTFSFLYLNYINKNRIYQLVLSDKLYINDLSFDFRVVKNIYSNYYVDFYGNDVKSLVITTNDRVYTYYLDYAFDNNDNFLYYDSLCNDLKEIFGNLFSKNEI